MLPPGDLEVVALCDGFVSTNGPGGFGMRYPQKHTLGTNDLKITIGMEPTARLEVQVMDERGIPIVGARVKAWPNVRTLRASGALALNPDYVVDSGPWTLPEKLISCRYVSRCGP